ncbi:MAG TPA: amidohydrolase family protein [Myxococcales bacterium]|nr:amidohydrolase family protein [Myxococcales bacterium]
MFALLLVAVAALADPRRDHPVAEHLFFRCKALIDPVAGRIDGAVIETNGGRILRVAKDLPVPAGAKVVDFGGKYVIPGLVDSHGHLYFGGITQYTGSSPLLGRFFLAAGVTSVVNPGSLDPGGDMAVRARIDEGIRIGPRYFNAGEYLEMPPAPIPWMNPVSTVEEARLKVDRWAAQGASAIKLYESMHGEVMQAAIDQAHLHGLKVLAHLEATSYRDAIAMGVDEIFHGAMQMADGRATAQPLGDLAAWARAVEQMDFDKPEVVEALRLAAQQKVVITPTLVVLQGAYFRPDRRAVDHMDEQRKYYSPQAWAVLEKEFAEPRKEPVETEKAFRRELEFTARAARAGCMLGTGTDLVRPAILPGFSLWREMELFAEAGIAPMDILKAATINGAYAIGKSDLIGSVAPGKLADFVALDRDPLESIANVRSVVRVVKAGVVHDPVDVLRGLEGAIP